MPGGGDDIPVGKSPQTAPTAGEPQIQKIRHQEFTFQGPLPPPQILAVYNQVVPNGADRIMKMAEKESDHRQAIERSIADRHFKLQGRGQWMGFTLAAVTITGGFCLVALDKDAQGMAAIVTALAALVGSFLYARYREEKAARSAPPNEPKR